MRAAIEIIKPHRLSPGDTIGIVAPSWCGPAKAPHRVERGIRYLESRGYNVVLADHATGCSGYVSGTPEERAADLHRMFADPHVKAILAAIGGDHSCHLLRVLDWELIRQNPKIVMGFSDMTVLNLATHAKTGLVTFNGPALMTDFGEFPDPFGYTIEYMERALCRAKPVGRVAPAQEWTEEFLDWDRKLDLTRPRETQPSPGWTWLKEGRGQGKLLGGCIESMDHLRGTQYWPNFDGAVLFLETSEEAPSPGRVDSLLQDYENMGVFSQIAGLLIGRPMYYTAEQKAELRSVVLERTRRYRFPIVTDMDFGHTAPQLTLPIGCVAEIDTGERRFEITESAVT